MKTKLIPALLMLLVMTAFSASCQVNTSYELTLEAAEKIMAEGVKYAKENNAPGGAIAIVDSGGNIVLLKRLTGTFPAASDVSIGKAQTAALFRFPTKKLEDAIVGGRTSLATIGHNLLRGGEPIMYKGQVIGAIGVSGAASADQDVEIAQAAAKAKFD